MEADRAKVFEALGAYRAHVASQIRKNMGLYVEYVSRQLPLDQDWTDEEINNARMEYLKERLGLGEFVEVIRLPEDVLTHWDEIAQLSGMDSTISPDPANGALLLFAYVPHMEEALRKKSHEDIRDAIRFPTELRVVAEEVHGLIGPGMPYHNHQQLTFWSLIMDARRVETPEELEDETGLNGWDPQGWTMGGGWNSGDGQDASCCVVYCQSWAALNESLGGRLLQPAAPGAVCHPGEPTYDADRCAAAQAGWSRFDFHKADPVSVMWDNWSNDTCLPDAAYLCRADGYSAFVVNATTPEHVKFGVDFARENNVRLIIKSTGHDYLGRSFAPGSLSIWVHHMQDVQYHGAGFQLAGSDIAIEGNAVTVGGGTELYNAQKALAEHGQAIVGGGCGTVGVGGFTPGGGHSLLGPRYGMAADNVLQMEIISPKGEIMTINEAQNMDLFWAMRGGGPGTFGVITSITFSTHPSPVITHTFWAVRTEPDAPYLPALTAYVLSQMPALERAGMSMYCTSSRVLMGNPFPVQSLPAQIAGMMGVALLQDQPDSEAMQELWQPINATIAARWPEAVFVLQTEQFASWFDWFDKYRDARPVGYHLIFASRLLDEAALTEDVDALAAAVGTATERVGRVTAFLVSGRGVHEAMPRGGGNAVHPAWRRAYVHAMATTQFPAMNATAKREAIELVDAAAEGLRELAPNMGSYINEGSVYEKDWQQAYWGANYERLLSIKKTVDPEDVLWCEP
ncbi:FAD-linked oxidoreductase ZEB1 [Colletotrichum siamense]|uniref:FAD-linked oxidoreductase ZEB1 n=1 Tax=Colletotrichum siamense TaxID=690259 RepID=UPI001872A2E7|nr:FAD-linked oxidoreductase ZEB1 [Colletotrichum siamense]KAF5489633.1 FAD-linked oxidoreductase ZEB1 [Colletotrichum siamense]